MNEYTVVLTTAAWADYDRIEDYALDRELRSSSPDYGVLERIRSSFQRALRLLEFAPFSCRRNEIEDRFRELIFPFGGAGFVVLFEIRDDEVLVVAIRHQLEQDFRH